jgi:hypothetical protein
LLLPYTAIKITARLSAAGDLMAQGDSQGTAGGKLRLVILVVASFELMSAVTYLPYLMTSWDEMPKAGFLGLYLLFRILIVSALAMAAFVLAYRRQRLMLAAILAALPPALFLLGLLFAMTYYD